MLFINLFPAKPKKKSLQFVNEIKVIKTYIKNNIKSIEKFYKIKSRGYDVLITTRIDYDDRIYYDAVNDVRKVIDVNKPMMLYGYDKGAHYYEIDNKYYEFNMTYGNKGFMSIFVSLIIILNKK